MGRPALNRKCSVADCGRKHCGRGYCATHLSLVRRNGAPVRRPVVGPDEGVVLRPIPDDPRYLAGSDGHIYSARFKHGTQPRRLVGRPAWTGYLYIRIPRWENGIHRESHKLVAGWVASAFLGPKPVGLQVRHRNGDQTDNRPSNLVYGTAKDNADDREMHGTTARGVRIHNASVPDERVSEAVRLYQTSAFTHREIAEMFGVHKTTIGKWVRGETRNAS